METYLYGFSKAQKGKFYHPDAKINQPIYLLKKDIALIEGVK